MYVFYYFISKIICIRVQEHSTLETAQNQRTLKACPKNDVLVKKKSVATENYKGCKKLLYYQNPQHRYLADKPIISTPT